MIKSNIVIIDKDFWGDTNKVIQVYEKMTNTKVYENFTCISVKIMDDIAFYRNKEENLNKYYKRFESSILEDKNLTIFCFSNKDDFEKFDIDGILKNRSIFIDKDEVKEKDSPMNIKELWTCIYEHYNSPKEGEYKVVLVDSTSGKEYFMGIHEPRRTLRKENDNTVEFSIYPVKTKAVKEVKTVKVSEFVQSKLKLINKNPNWLAGEMGVATSSLYGKLDRDSFNAYDLIKIAKIFNISFEELLELIEI